VIALAATVLSMSPVPVSGLIHEQCEGDAHMAQTIETLLRENIHGVFSDWGFGPAGAEPVVTGSDVLVMKGDKIGALYAFVDPPKK
jgi:hypothetical protein